MPRDSRIAAREAAAIPFPKEETTPPDTNTYLAITTQGDGMENGTRNRGPALAREGKAGRQPVPQASSGRFLKCSSASGLASASTFFTGRPCTTLRTASSTILLDLVRG